MSKECQALRSKSDEPRHLVLQDEEWGRTKCCLDWLENLK